MEKQRGPIAFAPPQSNTFSIACQERYQESSGPQPEKITQRVGQWDAESGKPQSLGML